MVRCGVIVAKITQDATVDELDVGKHTKSCHSVKSKEQRQADETDDIENANSHQRAEWTSGRKTWSTMQPSIKITVPKLLLPVGSSVQCHT